jgi:hypothetical protein
MSERTFRVTVRGAFDGLTEEQRAALLARAAEHDVLDSKFLPEGHLSYDLAMRPFFTFRFLETGQEEADITAACTRAQTAAELWLDGRGYGYKNLKVSAEDMANMPLAKKQKKAVREG